MRRAVAAASVALAIIILVPVADAATVSARWTASFGAQGSAQVLAYANGSGAVSLRMSGLTRSTTYPVALWRGTCASRTKWLALTPAKSSAAGSIAHGWTLTPAQTKAARAYATTGLVIRVGSRCAPFRAPAPQATPSPTPAPTPTLTPAVASYPAGTELFWRGGHGNADLAPFAAPANWEVDWSYDCSAIGFIGNFTLYAKVDGRSTTVNFYEFGMGGHGVVTVQNTPGQVTLFIISGCDWTVRVLAD